MNASKNIDKQVFLDHMTPHADRDISVFRHLPLLNDAYATFLEIMRVFQILGDTVFARLDAAPRIVAAH